MRSFFRKQCSRGKRFWALLLCIVMLVGIFPADAVALDANASTGQIGKHFEADHLTGELPLTPTHDGDTSKRYADGWVLTDKTISAGEKENEFLISLHVRTKADIEHVVLSEDAAVVIVLDLSNSMKGQRLANAKAAALAFVEKFAETEGTDTTRKIAVVGFSGEQPDDGGFGGDGSPGVTAAKTYQNWTKATSTSIPAAINGMQANGGTCLQAGLILAKNLLSSNEVTGITNKNIVVLTDGRPTYYLNDTAQNSTSTEYVGAPNQILGTGSSTNHDTHTTTEATAKSIVNSGVNVYGVYLGSDQIDCTQRGCQVDKSGARWLRENCGFITYAASDVDNLSLIFQNISELIALQAKAWIADDPIGDMFEFGGFTTTPVDPNEYYYSADGKVIWNLRMSAPVAEENEYKVYQLTYRVTLNTLASSYAAQTYYPTNGVTYVKYLMEQTTQGGTSEIDHGTAYFNVPSVKGYAANIVFNKVDENNQPLAGATFTLTATDNSDWRMTAASDANGVVTFTSVPSGHTYTLKETSAPADYTVSDTAYTLTVAYGKVAGTIGTDGAVVNTLKPGSLTVSKTVSGDDANATDEFTFTVTAKLGGNFLTGTYGGMLFDANGQTTFNLKAGESQTIAGLPAGTAYTVVENNHNGYTVTVNGTSDTSANGTIAANRETKVVFNNHKDAIIDIGVAKRWDDGNNQDGIRPGNVTVKLLADGQDTNKRLTLSGDNNWTDSFDGLRRYHNGAEISYTVEEESVTGYTSSITSAEGGYIITNTHIPETIDITGQKTWDDNNDQDGKRPESITIHLLANGTAVDTMTVTAADGWAWNFTDVAKYQNGQLITYTVTENEVEGYSTEINGYDITNTYTVLPEKPLDNMPQTGDNFHRGFWIALACLSLAGITIAAIGRKRFDAHRR